MSDAKMPDSALELDVSPDAPGPDAEPPPQSAGEWLRRRVPALESLRTYTPAALRRLLTTIRT